MLRERERQRVEKKGKKRSNVDKNNNNQLATINWTDLKHPKQHRIIEYMGNEQSEERKKK